MNILGIQDNHGASAALLVDGKVVAVAEEERYSRIKSDSGFPKLAIDDLRAKYPGPMANLDRVAMATNFQGFPDFATKRYPLYSVHDFLKEESRFWLPHFAGKKPDYLQAMKEHVDFSRSAYPLHTVKDPYNNDEVKAMRHAFTAKYLGVSPDKVRFVDHHTSHAYYAYYASPFRQDALIFTVDGWGDGANATVSRRRADGRLEFLYRTDKFNLGRIYRYITLLLGMLPVQHEYKVMGLAAYAKEHQIPAPLKIFEETYYVDGLEFKIDKPIQNHYQYFREKLEGHRFDAIAGALQRYTENLLTEWVRNWVVHTKLSDIVMSGGLALNIKASKRISESPEVSNMFVCMASGDNSISVGAAQEQWTEHDDHRKLQPITTPYLGEGFGEEDIREALAHPFVKANYDVVERVSLRDIARILTEGEIVGLMLGRMEFGPRALGHRSLLADPRNPDIVQIINDAIKNRDFWMPFTPSILSERAKDYLVNPKGLDSPYMTMAFDATELARKELPAAIHAHDKTMRPQFVYKEYSPQYHALISEFQGLTGVGGVLNTSFNIHGRPIVHKPINAVEEILTHKLVDLKYVVFEDVMLRKKSAARKP